MGLKLDKIRKNPAQFISITRFSSEAFDELALEFRIEIANPSGQQSQPLFFEENISGSKNFTSCKVRYIGKKCLPSLKLAERQ
jgi:hypothetical protein